MNRLFPSAARVAALMLPLTLAGCGDDTAKATKPVEPRTVLTQTVHYQPMVAERTFVATVRPRIESDLGFRVGGKVAERLVQSGERVKTGQVLARLDTTDLALQREQASAELTAARASLDQAESENKRIQQLQDRGWSTISAAERQRALMEEARGRLNRAERAVSLAANSLDYAALKADGEGIITATLVEPGQVIAAGAPAVRLARIDTREAVAAIPEALVDRVRSSAATVSLWSEPGRTFKAKLRELSPSADAATRTYQARFTILDAPDTLEFGLTATVTLTDAAHATAARLPLSALFNQGKGPSLFVVDPSNGTLTLKPVEVAGYESRDVLIRSGVTEGEQVVVLGVQKIDVTQKVRPLPVKEK
ncbi:MAG: efflux RND transporter periplasmic adaptor subunit [Proteobacteria bacterium]|nr:efflux RND transporter periplasmic adaptor subunit [Pseudomonadota bacterium]